MNGFWLKAIITFFVLTSLSINANAQNTQPTVGPPALWVVSIPYNAEYFSSPNAACQRQHQYFNPGAPYQSPVYVNFALYGCRWDMTSPLASTILPSTVYLSCDMTPGYSLSKDGRCVSGAERSGDCGCPDPGMAGPAAIPQPTVGNPISLNFGGKIQTESDYITADGLFGVSRSYRNIPRNAKTLFSPTEIAGFGQHWHGLVPGRLTMIGVRSELIEYLSVGGNLTYSTATSIYDTQSWTYSEKPSDRAHVSMVNIPQTDRITYFQNQPAIANGPAEVRMDMANGDYILFRRSGVKDSNNLRYLVPIEQGFSNGYKLWFDYPDIGEFSNRVRDSVGREMTLTWADVPMSDDVVLENLPPTKVISEIALRIRACRMNGMSLRILKNSMTKVLFFFVFLG